MIKQLKTAVIAVAFAATQFVAVAPVLAASKTAVPGNNGTLKVHELGTPVGTENNDPKVCAFNLEGFGFDAGQSGYLKFEVQGNDAPHGTATDAKYTFGATNTDGYAISQDFNAGARTVSIPNGHYKVTLYGKDTAGNVDLKDVKAKSKVFKVTCENEETPSNPSTPGTTDTSSDTPSTSNGDNGDNTNVPGNNGTLKVHKIGSPVGTEDNQPKVCAFNLEGFGFDAGQSGYLKFEVQGNDAPHGTAPTASFTFGPTDAHGYAISQDFNNGANTVGIPDGHYKVTLYGKDTAGNVDLKDVKAKSKVFKVTCESEQTPPTPGTTEGGHGGVPAGQVLDAATTTAPKTASMVDTGTTVLGTTLASALVVAAAVAVMRRQQKSLGLTQDEIELIAL